MKMLFVNSGISIGRTDSGGAVRTIMMLKALSEVGDVDVISFYEREKCTVEGVNVVYNGMVGLLQESKESRFHKFLRLLDPSDPYVYYTKNDREEEVVDSFVKENHYDLIVVRYFYQACEFGLLKYSDRLVIDVDDDPQDAFRSLAKLAKSRRNRLFIRLQSVMVKKMVDKVSSKVKLLYYSNPAQAKRSNTVYLPNVTLVKRESYVADFLNASHPPRMLFVGGLGYYPNRLGLEHFVNNIFPAIRERMPEVELRVVGKIDDVRLMNHYNSISGVECVGFVADIEKEYEESRVAVVPIYHGAGTSIKVLEAMKMRRPVVSTPLGLRGFDSLLLPERDCLLASNDEEFASDTIELLTNMEKNHAIANSAYDQVAKHFSCEKFCDIVRKSIMGLTLSI